MIDLLLTGANGKMGSLLTTTAAQQDDLRLVALVDPAFTTGDLIDLPQGKQAPAFATLGEALAACKAQVAVDFTVPAAVFGNVTQLLSAGVHTVVGTTGLDDDRIDLLRSVAVTNHVNLLVAPNFSIGATLMMRFAAEAARHFPAAEIVELHEAGKKDAPSGTALRTALLMAEVERGASATGAPARDAATTRDAPLPSRGLEGAAGIRIHSVRLPGLVAHQEVLLSGHGELLTLRHDTLSRESFMPGVLLAIRAVTRLGGTVVGLEHLLT